MEFSETQLAEVAAAIREAEARTDGEIAVVLTKRSDAYHDSVLQWSLLGGLVPLALFASFPSLLERLGLLVGGGWEEAPTLRLLLSVALVLTVAAFLLARLLLAPLGVALTPAVTKARRVRARALAAFRSGTEARTAAANGVLLYISLDEHRAEIVADREIQARVGSEAWGDAMAALLGGIAAGAPAKGIADAVDRIGDVLSTHFPRTGADPNEMPDRLIIL